MKPFYLISILFLWSTYVFSQEVQQPAGHLEAVYNQQTGAIAYAMSGDITKDGILLIELKNKALSDYEAQHLIIPDVISTAIRNERASLESLRHRILAQRERMMQPVSIRDAH